MKHLLLAHIFLLLTYLLPAQQKEFAYKNFTQADGLPSNETYYVFEDSKHYLWFASDNGVARYNGNRFEVFETPDRTVFQIREDHKGRVWFFTYRAQFAYFENGKMYPYKYNDLLKKRITKLHVKDVYIDGEENVFISSPLDSNYVIDRNGNIKGTGHYYPKENSIHQFEVAVSAENNCFTKMINRTDDWTPGFYVTVKKNNLERKYFIPLNTQCNSQYACTSSDGKNYYFFYGDIIAKLNEDGTVVSKKMPSVILSLQINEGKLYMGLMNEGLFVFNEVNFLLEPESYLKGRSITSILFDYEGGQWLTTTDKGIFYVKNKQIKHQLTDKDNQPDISYTYLLNDSTLIYATPEGLFTLTKSKNSSLVKERNGKVINIFSYDDNNTILCFGSFLNINTINFSNLPFNIKNLMLFSNPSVYTYHYKDQLISPTTLKVLKIKTDFSIYRSSYKSTKDKIISPVRVLLSKPAKIFMDKGKILWGAAPDGLYKSVAPYDTLIIENNSPLLTKGIDYITELDSGILAISTQMGNIVLTDKTNIIGNISEKNGILSSKVRHLLSLKNQLWIASQLGISIIEFISYKPLNYKIRNIDRKDGLTNLTINHLTEHNDEVIASTSNGLFYIKRNHLFDSTTTAIHFFITNINYYKGDISDVSSITLPYSKNRAIIKYRAVCFNSFESIQYRYRFTSGDTVWHSTTSNEIVLENLEPGNYILELKAEIPAQQRASTIQTLNILVEKPWWQNNWLRLLAFFFVSLLVYLLVKRRIRKIKAEEKRKTELNAKLTELEQTALRSQMNPHFIFNCLTSIQQLIISGNKVDANEYLVKFSRLIRTTLDMSAQPFISIREEKEYLEEYLFLEQLRMAGKFEYAITADESLNMDEIFIPNMMVQPIVENCVRHGIKALDNKKGIIKVTFSLYGKAVTCMVTDNGIGRKDASDFSRKTFSKHKSYGMDIVRKRLETFSEFTEAGSGIEIKDRLDETGMPAGTEVILHLPYKTHL